MSAEMAVHLFRQALLQSFWLAMPLLIIGLITGIVVSILQVLTSIQDTSFGAVPRLTAFLLGLLLLLPWMAGQLIAYTVALWGDLGRYAH
jgi:flagellar biosynthetic protein FliQ